MSPMPQNKPNIALSLGGSIVIPDEIHAEYLKEFREMIMKIQDRYNKIFIVIGGGKTARRYQGAAKSVIPDMSNEDLDWIGIYSTHFNAHFLQKIFKDIAHPEIIINPTEKIETDKKMIIGAGWLPGCSTDYDMVLMAETYGITEVMNLSNISYVYDKDPKQFPDAKPMKKMTWDEVEKLVGKEWTPGANVPFDPSAVELAKKLGLKVVTMKGTELDNVEKYLAGEDFEGTVIENL